MYCSGATGSGKTYTMLGNYEAGEWYNINNASFACELASLTEQCLVSFGLCKGLRMLVQMLTVTEPLMVG